MAVHKPDLRLIGGFIVPKNVGVSVSIEVADPNDAPRRSDIDGVTVLPDHGCPVVDAVAVHKPDLRFLAVAVVPKNISAHTHLAPKLKHRLAGGLLARYCLAPRPGRLSRKD